MTNLLFFCLLIPACVSEKWVTVVGPDGGMFEAPVCRSVSGCWPEVK